MAKKPGRTEVEFLSRTFVLYGVRHTIQVPAGPGAEAELDRACRETERRAKHEHVGARVVKDAGRPHADVERIRAALRKVRSDPWLKRLKPTSMYQRVADMTGVSPNTVKKYDPKRAEQ